MSPVSVNFVKLVKSVIAGAQALIASVVKLVRPRMLSADISLSFASSLVKLTGAKLMLEYQATSVTSEVNVQTPASVITPLQHNPSFNN